MSNASAATALVSTLDDDAWDDLELHWRDLISAAERGS